VAEARVAILLVQDEAGVRSKIRPPARGSNTIAADESRLTV
jgi:hypothetical protein